MRFLTGKGKKIAALSAVALPFVSFAEGASSTAITTSGNASAVSDAIANSFVDWITAAQSSMGILLGAGVAVVAIFFLWRVLKRVFMGSK